MRGLRLLGPVFLAAWLLCPLWAQGDGPPNTPQDTVMVGAARRRYYVHVPARYDPHAPAPLVLVFANLYEDGGFTAELTGFNAVADREGFLVVYPNPHTGGWGLGIAPASGARPRRGFGRRGFGFPGRGGGFPGGGYPGGGEYPGGGYPGGGYPGGAESPRRGAEGRVGGMRTNDLTFVDALLGKLERTYAIDPSRIYAVGMGDGGFMAMRLGCQRSGQFAAIATVGATLPKALGSTCMPIRPLAVLMLMGTKDPLVPYGGGNSKLGVPVLSAKKTAKTWAGLDNCARKPQTTKDKRQGAEIETLSYAGCARGTAVELRSIRNMGNTWPGSSQYEPQERFGKASAAPEAREEIWAFLRRYALEAAR